MNLDFLKFDAWKAHGISFKKVCEPCNSSFFYIGRNSVGSVLNFQITLLTTGYDDKFTNTINYMSTLAIAKKPIVMGRYHDASHSFPPLNI